MKVIYLPRGKGKTTELIKMAAKENNYIVCISQAHCRVLFNQAQSMELDIPFPITFSEFINHEYHGKGINGFMIDNADMLLQQMSSVPINAVTITDYNTSTNKEKQK